MTRRRFKAPRYEGFPRDFAGRTQDEQRNGVLPASADAPGNVLRYGADPRGASDSWESFQKAADSDHIMRVPAGWYYLSQSIVFSRPKIILMEPPQAQPMDNDRRQRDSRAPGPLIPESHTRIFTDQDIHFFEIRAPKVYGYGGTFDFQHAIFDDKAALYYPGESRDRNDRPNGWGGGWQDFMCINNLLQMDLGSSARGIFMDFQNSTLQNAYWTHMRFQAVMAGMSCCFYSSPRQSALSHWANTFNVDLEMQFCKQAVFNEAITGSVFRIKHQGSYVFTSEAEMEATPSIYSDSPIVLDEPDFFDFGKEAIDWSGQGDMVWMNKYSLDVPEVVLEDTSVNSITKALYIDSIKPKYNIDQMIGWVPHLATDNGMVISSINNVLWKQMYEGTYSVEAYQGDNGDDLTTVVTDSTTEGIPVSTDITLNSSGNFVKYLAQYESFTVSQQAADDGDYVEQVIGIAGVNLYETWIAWTGQIRQLQLILLDSVGAVIFNRTDDLRDATTPESGYRSRSFRSDHLQETETIIIRYIGAYDSTGITPQEICGVETKNRKPGPLVNIGGGTIFGDMVLAANLDLTGIPTSDPTVAGRLWNDAGTLKVSTG